jgi:hypothetical protein
VALSVGTGLALIPSVVPGVLLRSRLPPEVIAACKIGEKADIGVLKRPDSSLVDGFSELRDVFEAELKASQPWKDQQSAASSASAVEASITFLYTGK